MLASFKKYLTTLSLSPVSRKLYLSDIRHFLASLGDSPSLDILGSSATYEAYLTSLRSIAMAPSMLKRTTASLRQFGTFIASTYHLANPTSSINLALTPASQPLNDYIKHFTNYLNEGHLSPLTIKSYKSDMTRYFDWVATHLPSNDIAKVLTDKNTTNYLNYLTQSLGSLPSTIERKSKSLSRFKAWYDSVYSSNHTSDNTKLREKLQSVATDIQNHFTRSNETFVTPDQTAFPVKNFNYRTALTFAILVLFSSTLAIFGYRQFSSNAKLTAAYPSSPITPNRQLSFQGRLENAAGTPITAATNLTFKLYDASTSGTQLYTSGACSITPDADGVFSTQIGSTCGSAITSDVFSQNASVWLEVTVVADILSPRQQIASVAYALNSETLQGFPISSTVSAIRNTVVPMNQWGEIVVGEQSPKLKAVSGTFQISAPALSFVTTAGSNGNITLAPDGTGQVNLNGNTTSTNFFNVSNAQLTSGSLITGTVGNANTGYKLLDLLSGVSPTSKFSVSDAGTVTLAGNILPAVTNTSNLGSSSSLQFNNIYAATLHQGAYLVCDSNGTNCPAGSGYWARSGGSLSPTTLNDTISATTSAATAMTITQTGAFNALLVEDQASDSSPFIIDQSGNVGIGKTTANAVLDVAGTASISGVLTVGTGTTNTIQSPYGPLNLQYKDSANSWTNGITLKDTTGDIDLAGGFGSTGCTIVNSTGALSCTAGLTASSLKWNSLTTPDGALALTMPAGDETTFTVQSAGQTGFTWTTSTLTSGILSKFALTGSSAVATPANSGSLLTLTSSTTGFTGATQVLDSVYSSGANSNASVVLQGRSTSVLNTGTTNTNTAGYFAANAGSTANYGVQTGAITTPGATNAQLDLGAISGTANGSTNMAIRTGAISSAGTTTTNYGIQLGTMTGGTTSNYQIQTGNITAIASAINAGLVVGTTKAVTGTAASSTNYGINVFLMDSTGTINTGLNIGALSGATTTKGVAIGALSGATSVGVDVGALSGATADTGVKIGAISGASTGVGVDIGNFTNTGASQYGVRIGTLSGTHNAGVTAAITTGAISSAGTTTTNYGIQLGTMTGGTTSNYQIQTGNITAIASAINAGLVIGTTAAVTGTAASSTNYGININPMDSTGTSNTGLYVGAVSGATANYSAIFAAGNVGVGTTAPGYPLEVRKDQNAVTYALVKNGTAGTAAAAGIAVVRDGTAGMSMRAFSASYTTSGLDIANSGEFRTDSGLTGGMVFTTGTTAPIIFGDNSTETMRITSSKLGIGNTAPSATLDVTGTASVSGAVTLGNGSVIRPAYGPLTIQYKDALNSWTNGITIRDTTGDIDLAGGSGSTGCTIVNSTGAITCSGAISGGSIVATTIPFSGITAATNTNALVIGAGGSLTLSSTGVLNFGSSTYYIDSNGNGKFNDLIVNDSANPGLTVGNGGTGSILIGGSTISDNTSINGNSNLNLSSDTSQIDLADSASISGTLTIGTGTTNAIQTPYGPLTLNYKSGLSTYAAGLTVQDSTGYVGIGTTAPNTALYLSGVYATIDNPLGHPFTFVSGTGNGGLGYDDTAGFNFGRVSATSIRAGTVTSLAATTLYLSSTGIIGIGTTSPSVRLGQKLDIATSADYGGLGISTWSTTAAQTGILDFNTSRSATVGTQAAVSNNDNIGFIVFRGSDGTAFQPAAQVRGEVDGATGTNDMPGRLTFRTTLDGSITPAERMRIDNAGNVGIGTTAPTALLETSAFYSAATATEQFGGKFSTSYSAADSSLKQGLRLNTSSTNSSGTIDNLIGLLSLTNSSVSGGTTTLADSLWSRIDVATGSTITTGVNLDINSGSVTGTLTNQYGAIIRALTTGTNNIGIAIDEATGTKNTNLLIGTTTAPTGSYSIYNSSTDSNYFAGKLGIGNTSPGRTIDVTGNWGGSEVLDTAGTVSTSPTATVTEATAALVYVLDNTKTSGNNVTTLTWNITGLPDTDGTFAYISIHGTKNAGLGASAQLCENVKINSSANILAANSCSAVGNGTGFVNYQNFIVVRMNGSWNAFASATSANFPLTADLAEWIPFTGSRPIPGMLLSIANGVMGVESANTPYDPYLLGIVTTNPAQTYSGDDGHSTPMVLSGRVPVIVTSQNGQIASGDAITSSSISGIGMKATRSGTAVGKALESTLSWSVQSCPAVDSLESIVWPEDNGSNQNHPCFILPGGTIVGKIMAFLNVSWQEPQLAINSTGEVTLSGNPVLGYSVSTRTGLVDQVASFASVTIANLTAGLTRTSELQVDTISPLASGAPLTIQAPVEINPSSDTNPALVVDGELVASTISARTAKLNDLQADTITAKNIIADTISANHIEGLDAKLASLSATLSNSEVESITTRIKARLDELTGSLPTAADLPIPSTATDSATMLPVDPVLPSTASDSATLSSLDTDFVTINNYLAVIGSATITSLDVTSHLYTSSIESKSGTINLAAGTMIITAGGQVAINGDLTVSGKVLASSASLGSLELGTPSASSSALGKLLAVYNEQGETVATIDASGSASFDGLSTKLITIASANTATNSGLLSTKTSSNATAGESVLISPNTELTIESPYVGSNTLVYLTPTTNTDNKVLFVKSKDTGHFTVAIDSPASTDISFNWWVIQLK